MNLRMTSYNQELSRVPAPCIKCESQKPPELQACYMEQETNQLAWGARLPPP